MDLPWTTAWRQGGRRFGSGSERRRLWRRHVCCGMELVRQRSPRRVPTWQTSNLVERAVSRGSALLPYPSPSVGAPKSTLALTIRTRRRVRHAEINAHGRQPGHSVAAHWALSPNRPRCTRSRCMCACVASGMRPGAAAAAIVAVDRSRSRFSRRRCRRAHATRAHACSLRARSTGDSCSLTPAALRPLAPRSHRTRRSGAGPRSHFAHWRPAPLPRRDSVRWHHSTARSRIASVRCPRTPTRTPAPPMRAAGRS